MNKRHYEHTLPNIRGSLSNTYIQIKKESPKKTKNFHFTHFFPSTTYTPEGNPCKAAFRFTADLTSFPSVV